MILHQSNGSSKSSGMVRHVRLNTARKEAKEIKAEAKAKAGAKAKARARTAKAPLNFR